VHALLALAPNAPLATSIDAHAGLASHTDLADLAPEASEPNPAHGATSFAAEGSVETHLEPAPTATLPDADRDEWPTKKPERSMTVAWILWAIPAVLILAEFTGFALMFGAHWYYLGKMRRARTATFIWALTLAVFIVFRVFKALELSLLAGLVGLVGLLPLLVIMLYRLIADVILLSKISSKQARRALKTSRNRSRTAA
jgi:hypothetical protein